MTASAWRFGLDELIDEAKRWPAGPKLWLGEDQPDAAGLEHVWVEGLASLASAQAKQLSFVSAARNLRAARATQAGFLLTTPELAASLKGDWSVSRPEPLWLYSDNPYQAFAQIATWIDKRVFAKNRKAGIHSTAVIGEAVQIGEGVSIGPHVCIGDRVKIGDRAVISAGCVIGEDVEIGAECLFHPNVVIYARAILGDRVTLHAGAVIAGDGFGFAPGAEAYSKIPHFGRVRIGDDVEIGANTTVDRGTLDDTVVGRGVKLDNLVHIGHNVSIGEHTVVAGHAGLAGSAKVGRWCMVGGLAGVAGHIEVGDRVIVGPMSMASKGLKEPGKYIGAFPIDEEHQWRRNAAALRRLDDLRNRVRRLETELRERGLIESDAPSEDRESSA